jgi:hypothetical protein
MRQEEVCLECMMRDRDLADVVVAGEGAWERDSDVAWKDLKERERELTKSWNDDALSVSGTSFEDESSEPPSSPRSQANGLPDESQRNSVLRKQHLDARRAERDVQISRVGWRGFSWEEGTNGEGFPRGFRGNKPGALTEKGIKNVMQMVSTIQTTQ